jgi:hypothetical protein
MLPFAGRRAASANLIQVFRCRRAARSPWATREPASRKGQARASTMSDMLCHAKFVDGAAGGGSARASGADPRYQVKRAAAPITAFGQLVFVEQVRNTP